MKAPRPVASAISGMGGGAIGDNIVLLSGLTQFPPMRQCAPLGNETGAPNAPVIFPIGACEDRHRLIASVCVVHTI